MKLPGTSPVSASSPTKAARSPTWSTTRKWVKGEEVQQQTAGDECEERTCRKTEDEDRGQGAEGKDVCERRGGKGQGKGVRTMRKKGKNK